MNGFFRTLLISLLMLALPLQAAARIDSACQPSHGPAHMAQAVAGQSAESSHHGHTESGHHADASSHDFAAAAGATAAGHHAGCSVCAAFCAGVLALPAPQVRLPARNGSERVLAAPAAPIPEHLRAVLDRPPASS